MTLLADQQVLLTDWQCQRGGVQVARQQLLLDHLVLLASNLQHSIFPGHLCVGMIPVTMLMLCFTCRSGADVFRCSTSGLVSQGMQSMHRLTGCQMATAETGLQRNVSDLHESTRTAELQARIQGFLKVVLVRMPLMVNLIQEGGS